MEIIVSRDSAAFSDPGTRMESDELLKNYKFKVRHEDYGRTIRIKIIDRFNYVVHVDFTVSDNNISEFSCDGSSAGCGKRFCSHCLAAYRYLKEKELYYIDMPEVSDEAPVQAEKQEELSPAADDVFSLDTAPSDFSAAPEPEPELIGNTVPEPEAEESEPETSFIPREMKILMGHNNNSGEEVFYFPNDTDSVMNTNIGIIGTMGTGKTQFTKSLVTQLYHNQADNYDGTELGILIFDYKGDYNETKEDFVKATNARVIKPYKMPFNPLSLNLSRKNKALLPMHTANAFKDTLSKIYNLGPKQENTLFDCIMAAYKEMDIKPDREATWNRPAPTFETVYRQYEKSAAFNDNDKLAVVMKKLNGFAIFDNNPMRVVSLSKLLKGVLVIDLSDYDEDIQNLVVAITLDQFYAQMQTLGSSKTDGKYRQLKSFILVDEADNFMKMGFPSLRKIMKEGREFGAGVILSTQSLAHFCGSADDYSKYIITWVIHNVNDLNRKNIESILNQTQKSSVSEMLFQSIKGLKKHESVVKISNNEPIIMYDKPFWKLFGELTGRN